MTAEIQAGGKSQGSVITETEQSHKERESAEMQAPRWDHNKPVERLEMMATVNSNEACGPVGSLPS